MLAELRGLPAPAKLNLFLHVTGRRADGYHLLETVFELIDLCDTIDLVRRDGAVVQLRDQLPGVAPSEHLCVRAANALRAYCQVPHGVEIGLRKVIPVGGGLGGGSSDAATVLLGLNRLWGLGLDTPTLARIGVALGADVPLFLLGHPSFGRGIGEDLLPVNLPARWYVVVQPPVLVPTGLIFSSPNLTRDTKPLKITGFSLSEKAPARTDESSENPLPGTFAEALIAEQSRSERPELLELKAEQDAELRLALAQGRNDLQPVTEALFPEVRNALEQLRRAVARGAGRGGTNKTKAQVRMSGSGACVFVPVADKAAGEAVVRSLDERGPMKVRAWVVKSLRRHPLISD